MACCLACGRLASRMRQLPCCCARSLVPGESRQADSQMIILHGFQLGHFVSMYGNCFEVVCFRTYSSILAWQSLTFSPLSSAFGQSLRPMPLLFHRWI